MKANTGGVEGGASSISSGAPGGGSGGGGYGRRPRPGGSTRANYKAHTIEDYRKIKQDKYVELGKLQPDLMTDELIAKREKARKMKEVSRQQP